MTRRHFHSIVLAAIIGLVTFVASAGSLQAQNQKCCKYTVDVAGIIDKCLPFKVTTEWGGGFLDVFVVNANGIYIRPIPGPPPCPPSPPFNWVSLDGGTTNFVFLGQTGKYVDPTTGCCYLITVKQDANGCVYIVIRPC